MNFPKLRVRISVAEGLLLLPGLDTIVKSHAGATLGSTLHCYPFDRIDPVRAAAIYRYRTYDDGMAARVITLRRKLLEHSQSRKFRLDAFDLAVAAFALRQWNDHKPSDATAVSSAAVKRLQKKIERYRRRAKRWAMKKCDEGSYQETAERWRRYVAWMQYHLLYFKLPSIWRPRRARFWKEQRQLLALAITAALRERFLEISSDAEMTRIVTILSRSLRRGRHLRSLREVLKNPQAHTDFLVAFVQKRLVLKALPGAPVPAWQAYSERVDRFIAFARDRRSSAIARIPTGNAPAVATAEQEHAVQTPHEASDVLTSERKIIVSMESIVAELAAWFNNDVTLGFERPVVEQAQFLIKHNLHEQYRRQTTATTIRGLIEELRPAEHPQLAEEPINEYVGWVLGCLLAVRSDRSAIYDGVSFAFGRALAIREGRHNAG